MADYCEGIRDILYNEGVANYNGGTPLDPVNAWYMMISKMPDSQNDPDTYIAIVLTGGLEPNPKWSVDYPSIQCLIRGAKGGYNDALAKAKEIKDVLLGFSSADVNGDRWTNINMIGDIANLGYDESNRPMFSVNFSLIICATPSGDSHRQSL